MRRATLFSFFNFALTNATAKVNLQLNRKKLDFLFPPWTTTVSKSEDSRKLESVSTLDLKALLDFIIITFITIICIMLVTIILITVLLLCTRSIFVIDNWIHYYILILYIYTYIIFIINFNAYVYWISWFSTRYVSLKETSIRLIRKKSRRIDWKNVAC